MGLSLLQMSFYGTVMIAAVFIIRALAFNHLPKMTFYALWGIVCLRLLIPFSIPAPFSAYSLVNERVPALQNPADIEMKTPALSAEPAELQQVDAIASMRGEAGTAGISSLLLIWSAGFVLCSLFFTVSYCKARREFAQSLPADNELIDNWKVRHKTVRTVAIRQSGRILAPLTYGILKPVILMPKKTDWGASEQVEYILAHEFFHIRRFDAAAKLILTAVLCIHWFNPLVWAMYLFANRDIELSCDEAVVRSFHNAKADYARTLISMEEKKNNSIPLCSYFSKNAMEERITAIMKMKKTSAIAIAAAAIIITAVTAAFATTAAAPDRKRTAIADTGFTQQEYDQLLELELDGYQDMTVAQFQEKVWEMTDTAAYKELLERFSQDSQLYEMRNTNDTASYLFNTLIPLTAEHWQRWGFHEAVSSPSADGISDPALLEYAVYLTIAAPDRLTVGEYEQTRMEVMDGLNTVLQSKSNRELQDESGIDALIQKQIADLKQKWETSALQIEVVYDYKLSSSAYTPESVSVNSDDEKEKYPSVAEEDYQSLLQLKTADYQKQTVASFNRTLLDWANEDFERSERIGTNAAAEIQGDFTAEEKEFITLTVQASGQENAKLAQSYYTGRDIEDPVLGNFDLTKETEDNGHRAWANLFYQLTYHISDENKLTVGERDHALKGVIDGIQKYWNNADMDSLLAMNTEQMMKKISGIAGQYSTSLIQISFTNEEIHFECMSEPKR